MTNPPPPPSSLSSKKSSSSVFDRLYSKSTESARIRKTTPKSPTVPKNILERKDEENSKKGRDDITRKSSGPKPVPTKRSVQHKKKRKMKMSTAANGRSSVYDRLYSKSTASSKSKRSSATTTTTTGDENKDPAVH